MKNNNRCGKMFTQATVIASRHEIGILAKKPSFYDRAKNERLYSALSDYGFSERFPPTILELPTPTGASSRGNETQSGTTEKNF